MKPDPKTRAGMKEIQRRIKKREAEAEAARRRAKNNPDDEPSGKMTEPNDIDRYRHENGDRTKSQPISRPQSLEIILLRQRSKYQYHDSTPCH